MTNWLEEARQYAAGKFVHDLSPPQAKALAVLLELRSEGRPAETSGGKGTGIGSSTLKSLAKRGLVEIVSVKGKIVTARLK